MATNVNLGGGAGLGFAVGGPVGGLIGGGLDMLGGIFGAKKKADLNRQAYEAMINRANQGEDQFNQSINTPNSALGDYQQGVQELNKENVGETQGQIAQSLARSGVRGGQAATQYGRQIGDLQAKGMRDVNQLAYQDVANRQAAQRALYSQKAQPDVNVMPKYS